MNSQISSNRLFKSPSFDGTMGTTKTTANPWLATKIKTLVKQRFIDEVPSISDIKVTLISSVEGAAATSERSIYNRFNHIEFEATGKNRACKKVTLKGDYNYSSDEIAHADIIKPE